MNNGNIIIMACVMTNFSKGPQYQCQYTCLVGGQSFHADRLKANMVKSIFFSMCVIFKQLLTSGSGKLPK